VEAKDMTMIAILPDINQTSDHRLVVFGLEDMVEADRTTEDIPYTSVGK
jgi:hypothetical protein